MFSTLLGYSHIYIADFFFSYPRIYNADFLKSYSDMIGWLFTFPASLQFAFTGVEDISALSMLVVWAFWITFYNVLFIKLIPNKAATKLAASR